MICFFLFTSNYKCIFSNKEVGQLYQVSESKTFFISLYRTVSMGERESYGV